MKIAIYGAGYVGLVSAVCLAQIGHQVCCMDKNVGRITLLKAGQSPIFEKDLTPLLHEQLEHKRLFFTHQLEEAVHFAAIHFIAIGTPSLPDGHADLSQVFHVIEQITRATLISCSIVIKSTVPVGTSELAKNRIEKQLQGTSKMLSISLGSNPEFLREGSAVNDFLNADRIVIGGDAPVINILKEIYQPLTDCGIPLLSMSRSSAELTKYAANTMLACKISFINQMSQLAQAFDADIDHIAKGMALDHRIGSSFLQAGIGYGGSCFSKDLQALIQTFKSVAIDSSFIEAIDQINHQQKQWVIKQLRHHFKDELHGLRIGIWGLAFKPGTDDMREASSLVAIEALIDAGVHLIVYDPEATTNAQKILSDYNQIIWAKSSEQVLEYGLDALILMTEWQEFTQYPLLKLKKQLNNSPLFDGRNCYELAKIAAAQFSYYYSVGRPPILNVSSAAVRDKVLQKCM